MRISDWSSDVALPISVDLGGGEVVQLQFVQSGVKGGAGQGRIAHAIVFSCNLLSVAGGSFFARRIWSRTTTTRSAAPARLRLHCGRSEERRVGKAGVSTCRSRGSRYLEKKKTQ